MYKNFPSEIDVPKVKNELLQESPFLTLMDSEVAVFTDKYELLFNTNNYWRCSYTEYKDEKGYHVGYGYIDPEKWFSKEEIKEIEEYIYADPQPKKVGDLAGYLLGLRGFWIDNGMIIPEKIIVNIIYAEKFDDEGNLKLSGGTYTDVINYSSNFENTDDLPYFEQGNITRNNVGSPDNEKRKELRQMVTEQSRLEKASQQFTGLEGSSQRVGFLTYRYYFALPHQNTVRVGDAKNIGSDFWTVVGRDVNIGGRCFPSLIFVWISCLIIFGVAAFILAKQTFKTYKQQEETENQRKEMTDALAHDLKTPLGIITGYAENLQENVHTEKREHYANHIRENVDRMDQIIYKMLELTKLEGNSPKTDFEDVALAEVSKTIIDRYKPRTCPCSFRKLNSDAPGTTGRIKNPILRKRTTTMNYFKYGEREIEYLKKRDIILGDAIDKIGMIKRKTEPDIFYSLVSSIISQQISTKAAVTVKTRLMNLRCNLIYIFIKNTQS